MNGFHQHHRDSIRWHYRCFDQILLNGLIQPFQQPERVVGFFNSYRRLYPVTRQLLHGIADHFQKWLKGWTENAKVPVVDAPKGRRSSLTPTLNKPDTIVVVLKAREPARIPGLKLDHPSQLALMHALVRFAHIAAVHPKTSPSPPSATTSRNCAPRASSPNCLALGAISCSRKDTRSA